jgi:hypothetical protein
MIFLGMIVRASVQFVFVASFKVLCSRGSAYALYGVGSCGNSTRDIKVVIVQRVQAVVFKKNSSSRYTGQDPQN